MMFANLCPNELHGIEFWGVGWKMIDMQAAMLCDELLRLWTVMIFVIIPDQNNLTWNET